MKKVSSINENNFEKSSILHYHEFSLDIIFQLCYIALLNESEDENSINQE